MSFESFGVSEASEVSVFPVIDVDAPANPEPADDYVQFGDEDTPLALLETALEQYCARCATYLDQQLTFQTPSDPISLEAQLLAVTGFFRQYRVVLAAAT